MLPNSAEKASWHGTPCSSLMKRRRNSFFKLPKSSAPAHGRPRGSRAEARSTAFHEDRDRRRCRSGGRRPLGDSFEVLHRPASTLPQTVVFQQEIMRSHRRQEEYFQTRLPWAKRYIVLKSAWICRIWGDRSIFRSNYKRSLPRPLSTWIGLSHCRGSRKPNDIGHVRVHHRPRITSTHNCQREN